MVPEYFNFKIKFLDGEEIRLKRYHLEHDLDGFWYFLGFNKAEFSVPKAHVKYCITEAPE